jgi:hypothetical protein
MRLLISRIANNNGHCILLLPNPKRHIPTHLLPARPLRKHQYGPTRHPKHPGNPYRHRQPRKLHSGNPRQVISKGGRLALPCSNGNRGEDAGENPEDASEEGLREMGDEGFVGEVFVDADCAG